jgi:hypothetical protein
LTGICALLFSLVATWIDIGLYHEAKPFDEYPAIQITYISAHLPLRAHAHKRHLI